MINRPMADEEDLFVYLSAAPPEPVKYRHVKRGSIYTVLSDGEYHLHIFTEEGETRVITFHGQTVTAELQFSGAGKYAGRITIYVGEDGKYWMRPHYEFHELGRFERVVE